MKTATLFGIKNCDTVKKARVWLEAQNIEYQFIDFKQAPPQAAAIKGWIAALGEEKVLNKRSTTWKGLSQADKNNATGSGLVALICANPTLVKRPVLEYQNAVYVGFSEQTYGDIFAAA